MLKKFFISMLGSMAALWLSAIILFFMIIFGGVFFAAKNLGSKSNISPSILYIDLSGTIQDRESMPSIYDIISSMEINNQSLETIIGAIDAAADDKKIKGIYINCDGSTLGYASRGEMIDALMRFKKSGKWIYAYADNFEQGDYYIASVADSVYLNPVGSLNIHGISSQVMFYKDVLDRLGIDINVVRVGEYKSAVEPFLRMDMSEASRRQTTIYVDQIWNVISSSIAHNRKLADPQVVGKWADDLCFTWNPEMYVNQNAVTRLAYRYEVEDMLRKLTDTKSDKDLPMVSPDEYLPISSVSKTKSHVAVLYAVGDIVNSGDGGIVAKSIVPEIQALAKDDKVKGVVLRVNSPGGSAFASEQIWKALTELKAAGKPLYVSMGDYAASGGYYISCCADSIFCDQTTITGSIGIFGIIPNANRLIKDKIGLGISSVETSPNASFPSLYEAPSAVQLDSMQAYVERGYETFVSRVSQGRNIPVDSVKAIGGGRVWDGISAKEIGLVDGFANLHDVIVAMTKKVGLDSDEYLYYPQSELSAFETIIREASRNMEVNIEGLSPQEARKAAEYVSRLRDANPLQARMEMITIK